MDGMLSAEWLAAKAPHPFLLNCGQEKQTPKGDTNPNVSVASIC